MRPAELVQGLLIESRPGAVLDDILVCHLGIVVVLAQEQHLAAPKLHLVEDGRVGIARHQLIQHIQGFVRIAADFIRTRQLVEHRIVTTVIGIGLQQLLVHFGGAVETAGIDRLDILGQLFGFHRLELEVAEATHRLCAQLRIARNQVE